MGLLDTSSFVSESGIHLMGFVSLKQIELSDAIGLLLGGDFGVHLASFLNGRAFFVGSTVRPVLAELPFEGNGFAVSFFLRRFYVLDSVLFR
jgi:hypothetical protein